MIVEIVLPLCLIEDHKTTASLKCITTKVRFVFARQISIQCCCSLMSSQAYVLMVRMVIYLTKSSIFPSTFTLSPVLKASYQHAISCSPLRVCTYHSFIHWQCTFMHRLCSLVFDRTLVLEFRILKCLSIFLGIKETTNNKKKYVKKSHLCELSDAS